MTPSKPRAGVDSSVLMRLLTGTPQTPFEQAIAHVAETDTLDQCLLVSNLVVAEAYFACQHHYAMPKQDVLNGLCALLSKPVFAVEPGLIPLLGQVGLARAKPGFIDRLIHLEYSKAGTGLVSFEKSAAKLPGTEILPAPSPRH